MTLALTERLDIEVEPLDSLFGIDPERLPADDFRERAADMRLAWAVAADWSAPINFMRERRRRIVKGALTRAAIVAGVATGLGIAWRLSRSALLEPPTPSLRPAPVLSATPAARPAPARPSPTPPLAATPIELPPAALVRLAPPARIEPPPVAVTQPPPVAAIQPPPAAVVRPRASTPSPQPAVVFTPVPEPVRPPPPRDAQRPAEATAPAVRQAPARRPPPEETPLPFEGTLGSILYGSDRKLAIIDGRIVQVGDEVGGARVVEITPNSVLFRDRQGRLRRLTLDDSRR